MPDTIRLTLDGPVARIHLNRPEVLNALDRELAEAFRDAARRIAVDPDLRVVLLTGEGRAFMAGGDIGSFRAAGDDVSAVVGSLIDVFHETIEILTGLPVPVIAAVQGAAAGAGLSLMLVADLVIAAEDARFVVAYPRLGTSPDGGATWALPRAVGLRRALAMALLDEPLDAKAALELGLVARLVPAAELEAEALGLAQKLAAGPTRAFGRTKALLRRALDRDLTAQLAAERDSFVASSATADFAEGVDAFLGRRAPRFQGR